MNLADEPPDRLKKILRELLIMHELTLMPENHFTVKIHDVIIPNIGQDSRGQLVVYELFIVYDWIGMSLQTLKYTCNEPGQFTDSHLLCLTYNILCGLNFLESANIMHRKLLPENIFID